MKKENEIMREKSNWIDDVSKAIEKRIFESIETNVDNGTWTYWNDEYIPIAIGELKEIGKEVFRSKGVPSLEENYHNVAEEVWEKVYEGLDEELLKYGFKIGYNKSREFGVGPAEGGDIRGINEKNTFFQKLESLWEKIKMLFSYSNTSNEEDDDDFEDDDDI